MVKVNIVDQQTGRKFQVDQLPGETVEQTQARGKEEVREFIETGLQTTRQQIIQRTGTTGAPPPQQTVQEVPIQEVTRNVVFERKSEPLDFARGAAQSLEGGDVRFESPLLETTETITIGGVRTRRTVDPSRPGQAVTIVSTPRRVDIVEEFASKEFKRGIEEGRLFFQPDIASITATGLEIRSAIDEGRPANVSPQELKALGLGSVGLITQAGVLGIGISAGAKIVEKVSLPRSISAAQELKIGAVVKSGSRAAGVTRKVDVEVPIFTRKVGKVSELVVGSKVIAKKTGTFTAKEVVSKLQSFGNRPLQTVQFTKQGFVSGRGFSGFTKTSVEKLGFRAQLGETGTEAFLVQAGPKGTTAQITVRGFTQQEIVGGAPTRIFKPTGRGKGDLIPFLAESAARAKPIVDPTTARGVNELVKTTVKQLTPGAAVTLSTKTTTALAASSIALSVPATRVLGIFGTSVTGQKQTSIGSVKPISESDITFLQQTSPSSLPITRPQIKTSSSFKELQRVTPGQKASPSLKSVTTPSTRQDLFPVQKTQPSFLPATRTSTSPFRASPRPFGFGFLPTLPPTTPLFPKIPRVPSLNFAGKSNFKPSQGSRKGFAPSITAALTGQFGATSEFAAKTGILIRKKRRKTKNAKNAKTKNKKTKKRRKSKS